MNGIDDYKNFDFSSVIHRSWVLIRGSKGAIWGANIVMFAISSLVMVVFGIIIGIIYYKNHDTSFVMPATYATYKIIAIIITSLLIAPLLTGTFYTAIKRWRCEKIDAVTPFQVKGHILQSMGALLVMSIANILIQMICLSLGEVFTIVESVQLYWLFYALAITLMFFVYCFFIYALPITIDKNIGCGYALSLSFRCVCRYWWQCILMTLYALILIGIASLPLIFGIPAAHTSNTIIGILASLFLYIWILPYSFLILAGIYVHIDPDQLPSH